MKFLFRWIANSVAFYLALYLLDSLVAPRFWVQAVWVAVIVAIFLALVDSLIRPLHRLRTRPYRALVMAVFTLVVNALVLQVFVWAGASLSTTSPAWVLVAAVFLGVLGGIINWIIGFRVKEKPGASIRESTVTREKSTTSRATERGTRSVKKRDAR